MPLVTRLNLNYNELQTDIIKPRFHLQPLKELMENGFVHDEVVDELSKLVRTLENSITKEKKKKNNKKINKISNYLRMSD